MAKVKGTKFEDTLHKLEAVVTQLEQEETGLESSIAAFEEGIKLVRHTQADLQDAMQRVQTLIEENGEPVVSSSPEETAE